MKSKTIKAALSKKMHEWWASIEDVDLRDRVAKGTIVTGGCIASMLLKEKVNDYDVYLRNEQLVYDLANYYVKRFAPAKRRGIECAMYVLRENGRVKIVVKSAGIASAEGTEKPYQYFEGVPDTTQAENYVADVMNNPGEIEDTYEATQEAAAKNETPGYVPVFLSTNAITLSGGVQIVLRFHGEPEEIHKNYDFVHCTNYWASWTGTLTLHQAALESLLARELRYVGSLYPICSLFRLRKFIARGWTVNAGQILKMVMQISDLNLGDLSVLEDQLTGVDAAYFVQLVESLRDKDPTKVNAAYLVEIIDRMF